MKMRAIVQSCNRAIVQSCNRAIVQSCRLFSAVDSVKFSAYKLTVSQGVQ